MDASSGALNRDQQQHEDPEWHAAVQLVGLCVPVADSAPDAAAAIQLVGLSVPAVADSSPNSVAAAAAAPDVSFKNDADGCSGKDKELKKPDTVIPCARCNSTRTKFCYYNNYNVNQPRYHCKDCKRYWTVGGILRDVPIGTTRHKNKNNGHAAGTSHNRSCVLKPLSIPGPSAEGNGAVTTYGVLKLLGKSLYPTHNVEENKDIIDLVGSGDNMEEKSCLSSGTTSGSSDNSALDSAIVTAITASSTQLSVDGTQELVNNGVSRLLLMPPMMPHLGRTRAPIVPSPQVSFYWSYSIPDWPNGASSVPQCASGGSTLPPVPACSGGYSLAFKKHLREEEGEVEKTFWVPKVLRVTNSEDAAKSTIWASLDIEPDERILQPKDENGKAPGSPAASCSISCSVAFQKRT